MTTIGVKHVTNNSNPVLTRMTTSANILPGWNNGLTSAQATSLLNSTMSPYSGMTRCNVWLNGTVTAIYGDRCYTDTDSTNMGPCMVKIPAFYYYVDTSMAADATPRVVYWISNALGDVITKEDTTTHTIVAGDIHPAFQLDGVTKSAVYIASYEGSEAVNFGGGGVTILNSASGVTPLGNTLKATLRGYAEAVGLGWELMSVQSYGAVAYLFINEYASLNCHSSLGNGCTTAVLTTGGSILNGNTSYGTTANSTTYMTYRGLENLWGNYLTWIDGLHIVTYQAWTLPQTATRANYQDTVFPGTGYADQGFALTSTNDYVTSTFPSWMFLGTAATGGDASKYYCNIITPAAGNRSYYFGPGSGSGGIFGGFFGTNAVASAGSRTQYIG